MISALSSKLFCRFADSTSEYTYDIATLDADNIPVPFFKPIPTESYPSIFLLLSSTEQDKVCLNSIKGLLSFALSFEIDWSITVEEGVSGEYVELVFEVSNNGTIVEKKLRLSENQSKYNFIATLDKDIETNTSDSVVVKCLLRCNNVKSVFINKLNNIYMSILSA